MGPGVVHNLLDLIRGVDLLLAVGPVTCKPRKGGKEQGKALGRRDIKINNIYIYVCFFETVEDMTQKIYPLTLTYIYNYYFLYTLL